MVDAADLRAIKADLAHLSARVEELFQTLSQVQHRCNTRVTTSLKNAKTAYAHIDLLDGNVEYILERLKNIEFAIIPSYPQVKERLLVLLEEHGAKSDALQARIEADIPEMGADKAHQP